MIPRHAMMWGLADVGPWAPWPTKSPPELAIAGRVDADTPVCALLGAGGAGIRGRFGLVGIPQRVAHLSPGPGVIADAIDQRPADAIRIVVLGYEIGAPEAFLAPESPPRGQPAGLILDLASAAIVDHATERFAIAGRDRDQITAISNAISGPSPRKAGPMSDPTAPYGYRSRAPSLVPVVSDHDHQDRIRRALAHIVAGDIYQANIARRLLLTGSARLGAIDLLAALYQSNPVAHAAYIRSGGIELLSNSMETLLTFDPETRVAESFPIKGTCGRVDGDDRGGQRLVTDAKEQAEHVMIVDLVRNDLGRVCVPGSVSVPELMGTYGFRGVWHGVSTIRGSLAPDRTPGELLAALFPGGSITGAPKRRAMQIIRDLEAEPRGLYTGSVALVMPDGRLSVSILIRTLVRDSDGWSLSVGGGIVADSIPAREICETWEKIEVFRQLFAGSIAFERTSDMKGARPGPIEK